jgi:Ca2+-binding EF-hand superfamily protein
MIAYFLSALLSVASADPPTPPPAAPGTSASPHGGPGGRATLFVSPMGEPFRGHGSRAAGLDAWFAGADKDGNGQLSNQEMRDDAARFYVTLDVTKDGEIDPDDVRRYENDIAPEIQISAWPQGRRYSSASSYTGSGDERLGYTPSQAPRPQSKISQAEGLKGAGRLGLLNIPEPVISADADLNRGVSEAEFLRAATTRFVLLDTNRDGKLSRDELQAILAALPADRGR